MEALGLDEIWWLVSPGNPLKPKQGMAPLDARFRSALVQARRAPIRVTAMEQRLQTRYTVDTLKAIKRLYPKQDFIWLMGSDNLAQFHHWRQWREIGRTMPIAVIARPGYDADAIASPAMAWLRRYLVPASRFRNGTQRSAPALVTLRFDPDSRSATSIRRADPNWASHYSTYPPRDQVTHRKLLPEQSDQTA
ncbi:nicotinate-nucleotide adenylyltransferase [Pontixanthobacter gangjinensis]